MSERVTWALKWRDDGEWLAFFRFGAGRIEDIGWSHDKRDRIEFGSLGSAQMARSSWPQAGEDVAIIRIVRRSTSRQEHTDATRDLADELGLREGKHTPDSVARRALWRLRDLRAVAEAVQRWSTGPLRKSPGDMTDAEREMFDAVRAWLEEP